MDNAQKAIMIGVGLFITIIVIAAVMAITGIGQDLLNKGQGQLAGISGQLEQQLNNEFNNVNMSGAQVLAAINRFYNDGSLVVVLYNTANAIEPTLSGGAPRDSSINGITADLSSIPSNHKDVTEIEATAAAKQGTRIDIKDYTTNGNINQVISSARYKSVLIKNKNTASVMGIAFLKVQ